MGVFQILLLTDRLLNLIVLLLQLIIMILQLLDLRLHIVHLLKHPLIDLLRVVSLIDILWEIHSLNLVRVDDDLPEILLKLVRGADIDNFVHYTENVFIIVEFRDD